ncbi:hypothetical protein PGT21_033463 [Puccinia graminis f. sp. tritici]|uniref:Uncharacterized protein n=1 Tax=Puccinia graminis f. sp. tritici TaxID=56615 RepID=A0A5B0NSG2_PUCGR|nr:hypothetical protein PGTUg99_034973 [Puccinia graminis f. sp. tritici]KAA1091424.1 hypothetical protein PGT21_033463 [Puccinia graminis f. sp. tritici]
MKLTFILLATSTLIYQVWGLSQLFEFDQKSYLLFDAKFENKNGAGLLGQLKRQEGTVSNDEGTFIFFKNLGPKTLHFINYKYDFKLTPGQHTRIHFTVDDSEFVATEFDEKDFDFHMFQKVRNTWKQVIHVEKS